jgi:hypothetical protein
VSASRAWGFVKTKLGKGAAFWLLTPCEARKLAAALIVAAEEIDPQA